MKKQVSFKNHQIVMAGELYCPEGLDERIKYPAVVVTHPAGAVKEQSPKGRCRMAGTCNG